MAAAKLSAGRLRHVVDIEHQVSTVNSNGENEIVWENYATNRHAEITDLSGNAILLAQQIQSEVRTRILLRYDAGLMESMRILWRGFVFDIKAIQLDPDSGLEYMTAMCARGLNAG